MRPAGNAGLFYFYERGFAKDLGGEVFSDARCLYLADYPIREKNE
jgi:hypothetical protein